MPHFECTKCKYKLDKDKAPPLCPYCSEEGTMAPEKSAQDFLNESEL
ncbi:MAG: hypothetical protein KJ709_08970 [Nanoarchaeota archaeon]|nr:hypothetical protein [Nanoarchaeota archaeon]